jgi:hypothetical protein
MVILLLGFLIGSQLNCSSQSIPNQAERIRAYVNQEACDCQIDGIDDPYRLFEFSNNPGKAFVIVDPSNVVFLGRELAPEEGLSLARFKKPPTSSPASAPRFPPALFYVERQNQTLLGHQPVFGDGIGMVSLADHKMAGIDPSGKFVLKPGSIPDYRVGKFREGRAVFYTTSHPPDDRRWRINDRDLIDGFIDRTGKVIFSSDLYKTINRYSEHLALAQMKVTGKFGYLDWDGHLVVPARFDKARDFSEGLAAV